jgi:PncC family amidohydrolase
MKSLKLAIIASLSLMAFNVNSCEKHLAEQLVNIAKEKKLVVATAESCTGGMISSAITAVPGSSSVFSYGFVTYGNDAKEKLLNVQHRTIEQYGAVSEETAREMAIGALNSSRADIAVAVTGIAGPTGGTDEKPVGLVYIALATKDRVEVVKNNFTGDRSAVRLSATKKALEMSIDAVENQ